MNITQMAQWSMAFLRLPLPVVRVQMSLGADFQRNIMFLPSQRWNIVSIFVSLSEEHYMLLFTQV